MNRAPLVSVIIPTYNQSGYLKEAIDSVLNQTFSDWEVIVINNFSEDDTEQIVAAIKDARVSLYNFKNHGVIAASRNYGINKSQGKYLAFLDSDDYWLPEKLETSIKKLEEGADLICHGLHLFGNGYDKDRFYGPEKAFEFKTLLNRGNCVATSAVVVKSDLVRSVGGMCEQKDMATAEDYHLWLKLSKIGIKASFINKVLGAYRYHGENSGSVVRQANAVKSVINDFFPEVGSRSIRDSFYLYRRLGIIEYGLGRSMQSYNRFDLAWSFFWNSLKLHPFYLKTYIAIFLNLVKVNIDK